MSVAPRSVQAGVNGWNAEYLDGQYLAFRADPTSVPADLRSFFQGFDLALAHPSGTGDRSAAIAPAPAAAGGAATGVASRFQFAVDGLLTAYRRVGHVAARLDPFGRPPERPESLQPRFHGLSDEDLPRQVDGSVVGLKGSVTLQELIDRLEQTYCGSIGLEFTHISDYAQRDWILKHFERVGGRVPIERADKLEILEQLTRADAFESFIQKRYPGEKRFSLEGGEALIVLVDRMIDEAATLGVDEIVVGMAHRGRLNVLNNVMGKSYEQIFTEFEDNWEEGFADGGGDVKYHRGYSGARKTRSGKIVHLAMASNPSHLESVNPVVLGRCRAKQRLHGDPDRRRAMPLLIHGDAAVAGQGIIAECLNLSQLEGYRVGGCVHVVINNMIGFTTTPEDGRSTRYCTDVAKMVEVPILHVNGEDPEAVVAAAILAARYRQEFKRDVFVDMLCYRKYGHNEGDEPSFTQPVLAALIKKQPSIFRTYSERLVADGVITPEELKALTDRLDAALDAAQAKAKKAPHDPTIDPAGARWAGMTSAYSHAPVKTGVSREVVAEVAGALGRVPEGFNVNPKLKHLLQARADLAKADPNALVLNHADAELLAFGTLLVEAVPIRLSGQDCRRGTFTQRHAVLRDAVTGDPYNSLNNLREMGHLGRPGLEPGTRGNDGRARQSKFCVYDSPLSEVAVMGFDYGYSLGDPNMLVLWEGQFGDFANGAQVIIDQYLASSELKWDRWSGLVLLLPHGYEGAGPEHSSARLERFLSLCADDNMEVVCPTTGAQHFHMLRRQVKRNFRKPLIVMTPKSMLREPTSGIGELVGGHFQDLIDDPAVSVGARKGVRRVVYCTGKVYHELSKRREAAGKTDVAIVRIEQLYPLNVDLLREIDARYPKGGERVWVQEEPRNAGAYTFISDRFRNDLGMEPAYIGREPSASPAVGSKHVHKQQQEEILASAIGPASGPKGPKAGPGASESKAGDAKTTIKATA